MLVFVWVNSFVWGLAPLFGWSRIWYEPTNVSCTVDIMHPNAQYVSYILVTAVWCYALPVLVMIYFKIKMYNRFDQNEKDARYIHKVRIVFDVHFFHKYPIILRMHNIIY